MIISPFLNFSSIIYSQFSGMVVKCCLQMLGSSAAVEAVVVMLSLFLFKVLKNLLKNAMMLTLAPVCRACCSAAKARQQSSCDCQAALRHPALDSVSVTKGGNSVYTWPSSKQMTQTGSATH